MSGIPSSGRSMRAAFALALAVGLGASSSQALAAPRRAHPTRYARAQAACPRPTVHRAGCFAMLRRQVSSATAAASGVRPFIAGDGAYATGEAGGLTPADIATAYGYNPAGGSGQTVALVDAYNDPKLEEDLGKFDEKYGLGECTKVNGCLTIVGEKGTTKLAPNDKEGWSYEISLDVESVRAVCQGCKIVLVEAESAEYKHLAIAMNTAVEIEHATEVSNSYGGPEIAMKATEQAAYSHPGVVVTASTGDFGWDDWNYWLETLEPTSTPGMPNAPASLNSVVSVGGTSLELDSTAERIEENVWNDDGPEDIAGYPPGYVSGGGCSLLFAAPSWQSHAAGYGAAGCGGERLSADVAAVGDPMTGFDIYDNFNWCAETNPNCSHLEVEEIETEHAGWETFGGTSLSSPIIAAMYALAGGDHKMTYPPAITLYGHLGDTASLYDVTKGGNGFCDGEPETVCGHPNQEFEFEGIQPSLDCEGTSECDARPGFDGPSGVGAPVGLSAFEPLFPTAVATPPAWVAADIPASVSSSASTDPYPGGTITGWKWGFGDGTEVATVAAPTHTYTATGHYTITLSVQDAFGLASSSAELPVNVLTEAEGRQKLEEEAAKKKKEEEARKKAEEEARKKAEEEAKKKAEEEARKKAAEEAAHKKAEEEAAHKKAEEEAARRKAEEEAAAKHGVLPFQATISPTARIAGTSLRVGRGGVVHISVSCPAGVVSCSGTLTLHSPPSGSAAHSHKSFTVSVSFTVAAGKTGTVTLHLPARARTLLARAGVLKARVSIASHDPAGATATSQSLVSLRPALSHHH